MIVKQINKSRIIQKFDSIQIYSIFPDLFKIKSNSIGIFRGIRKEIW